MLLFFFSKPLIVQYTLRASHTEYATRTVQILIIYILEKNDVEKSDVEKKHTV